MSKFYPGSGGGVTVSSHAGEIALPRELYPLPAGEYSNAFGVLRSGANRIISSFKGVLRNKRKLMPAIVLAVLWLLLTLLPALGINPVPVRFLSWLTFARGGLTGGILNRIGGIIGKGLLASLLTISVTDKSGFRQIKAGLSNLKDGFTSEKTGKTVLIFGIGVALIVYNLMVADTTLQNSMAGIACFALSLRALERGGGFAQTFFTSLTAGKKPIEAVGINRFMSGWTAGFALGVLISVLPLSYGGYLFGTAAVIAGVILAAANKETRGSGI